MKNINVKLIKEGEILTIKENLIGDNKDVKASIAKQILKLEFTNLAKDLPRNSKFNSIEIIDSLIDPIDLNSIIEHSDNSKNILIEILTTIYQRLFIQIEIETNTLYNLNLNVIKEQLKPIVEKIIVLY